MQSQASSNCLEFGHTGLRAEETTHTTSVSVSRQDPAI